jgi:PTH1 family peptidyl-tRNA hydrolase
MTRHNAGFLFLDFLRESWGFPDFEPSEKWKGSVSAGMRNGEKTLLVKPATFMNRSGECVRAIMDFFKLSMDDLVVIHDDLDIGTGSFKTTKSSRAAGHNGVADLIEKLGTQDFRRIRIGIGRPKEGYRPDTFVLGRLTDEEYASIRSIFPEAERFLSE